MVVGGSLFCRGIVMIVRHNCESLKIFSRRSFLSAVFLFFPFCFTGCSVTGAKKKESEPLSVKPVDDHGLRNSTKKVIVKINNMEYLRSDRKENSDCTICFLGITDSSGHQIPEINEAIRAQFHESTSYSLISEKEIDQAVEKAEVKRNDIFIPEERKKFTQALDRPFRYFLSGQVMSIPSGDIAPGELAGDQIVFDLVNSEDNEQAIVQDKLASIYNDPPHKKVMGLF